MVPKWCCYNLPTQLIKISLRNSRDPISSSFGFQWEVEGGMSDRVLHSLEKVGAAQKASG